MAREHTPIYDDRLPPEEFERRVAQAFAELDGEEGEEIAAFIAWFVKRYPTPLERLRFASKERQNAERLRGALLRKPV